LKKKLGIRQSMSRRGNCWDNAPIESFFGHLKDETYIKSCLTLEDVQKEIKQYIIYYNHHRYQWNRKKMTPVQYRDHLLEVA
ncbi:IS3 family transposase, partial [Rossellomorea vietnamensis]